MSDKTKKFYKIYPDVIYSHNFFSLPEMAQKLYLYICINSDEQNLISDEMLDFLSIELKESVPRHIFESSLAAFVKKGFIADEK